MKHFNVVMEYGMLQKLYLQISRFFTSFPPSEDKLPLKYPYAINVNMILSFTHEHKALGFSSVCLSATIPSQSLSTLHASLSPFHSYPCPLHSGPHCLKIRWLYTELFLCLVLITSIL